jgi:hypothetical protein
MTNTKGALAATTAVLLSMSLVAAPCIAIADGSGSDNPWSDSTYVGQDTSLDDLLTLAGHNLADIDDVTLGVSLAKSVMNGHLSRYADYEVFPHDVDYGEMNFLDYAYRRVGELGLDVMALSRMESHDARLLAAYLTYRYEPVRVALDKIDVLKGGIYHGAINSLHRGECVDSCADMTEGGVVNPREWLRDAWYADGHDAWGEVYYTDQEEGSGSSDAYVYHISGADNADKPTLGLAMSMALYDCVMDDGMRAWFDAQGGSVMHEGYAMYISELTQATQQAIYLKAVGDPDEVDLDKEGITLANERAIRKIFEGERLSGMYAVSENAAARAGLPEGDDLVRYMDAYKTRYATLRAQVNDWDGKCASMLPDIRRIYVPGAAGLARALRDFEMYQSEDEWRGATLQFMADATPGQLEQCPSYQEIVRLTWQRVADAKARSSANTGANAGDISDGTSGTKVTDFVTKPVATVTMLRAYNPNSGEHLYTASAVELRSVVDAGWKSEGTAWKAPVTGRDVYRVYNPNSGLHHYTTSAHERDELVRLGWRYEGVCWHDAGSGVAVHRLYNANDGQHHYTTSTQERDTLVRLGWSYEGVAWHGCR